MAQRHIGEAVRRVAEQVAAADLNAVWGRVQQDPVDESALRDLVDRWGPGFLSYCRAVLGDSHSAEDVVSAAFVVIIRNRHKLSTAELALRYLWKTVARAARRARWKAARRPDRTPLDGATPAADPRDTDPVAQAVRDEVAADVSEALGKLSENERCAVVLVTFLGHTEQGAADVMGCGRSSVSTYLTRAKEKLGRLLVRWKDAVGATGGVTAVDAALTEAARAGGLRTPSAALVESILRQAAMPVRSVSGWAKAAAVLLALGAAGGATLAVWPAPVLPDSPPDGAIVRHAEAPPTTTQTVPQRNLRVFRAEVLPKQLLLLKGLLIGDGKVELATVKVYDTRLEALYVLHHKLETSPGWVSKLSMRHNTINHGTECYFDLNGHGDARAIDTKRPIVLWRNPFTKQEVVLKIAALEQAQLAFNGLPQDKQTAEEWENHLGGVEQAIAPMLGTWYVRGNASQICRIWKDPASTSDGYLHLQHYSGGSGHMPLHALRIDSPGWVGALPVVFTSASVSGDGQQLRFTGTDEWWSRHPIIEPP